MNDRRSRFDPIGFLDLAERLTRRRGQAELRSAISRAYYAAFLIARENEGSSVRSGTGQEHALVAIALGARTSGPVRFSAACVSVEMRRITTLMFRLVETTLRSRCKPRAI